MSYEAKSLDPRSHAVTQYIVEKTGQETTEAVTAEVRTEAGRTNGMLAELRGRVEDLFCLADRGREIEIQLNKALEKQEQLQSELSEASARAEVLSKTIESDKEENEKIKMELEDLRSRMGLLTKEFSERQSEIEILRKIKRSGEYSLLFVISSVCTTAAVTYLITSHLQDPKNDRFDRGLTASVSYLGGFVDNVVSGVGKISLLAISGFCLCRCVSRKRNYREADDEIDLSHAILRGNAQENGNVYSPRENDSPSLYFSPGVRIINDGSVTYVSSQESLDSLGINGVFVGEDFASSYIHDIPEPKDKEKKPTGGLLLKALRDCICNSRQEDESSSSPATYSPLAYSPYAASEAGSPTPSYRANSPDSVSETTSAPPSPRVSSRTPKSEAAPAPSLHYADSSSQRTKIRAQEHKSESPPSVRSEESHQVAPQVEEPKVVCTNRNFLGVRIKREKTYVGDNPKPTATATHVSRYGKFLNFSIQTNTENGIGVGTRVRVGKKVFGFNNN